MTRPTFCRLAVLVVFFIECLLSAGYNLICPKSCEWLFKKRGDQAQSWMSFLILSCVLESSHWSSTFYSRLPLLASLNLWSKQSNHIYPNLDELDPLWVECSASTWTCRFPSGIFLGSSGPPLWGWVWVAPQNWAHSPRPFRPEWL